MSTVILMMLALTSQSDTEYRDVLRERVRPDGQVDAQLATATGWQVLRGLRWQLLTVDDRTGKQSVALPGQAFKTGTAYKFKVEAYSDLYLYVFNRDSRDHFVPLFPETDEGHHLVRRDATVKIPPDPSPPARDHFRFVNGPDIENFYILASPRKLDWAATQAAVDSDTRDRAMKGTLDQAATRTLRHDSLPQAIQAAIRASEQGKRQSKDIELQPPPIDGGHQVYFASTEAGDTGPIVIHLKLTHRP